MNVPALMATYQLRQREYLLHITRAMTSRLDLPSLLKLILRSAAEMVDCRTGLVVLKRDELDFDRPGADDGHFEVRTVYDIPPSVLPAFAPLLEPVPLAPGDNGILQVSDQFDLTQRVRKVEENLGVPAGNLGQVVGLPLLFEETLLGVIYLFRGEHAFTPLDSQFLQGFADQAAVAVRNARLYQALERERTRLAALVENSANGVMILDADRRVLVMNRALAALVDMEPDAVSGLPCDAVLVLDNVEGVDLCQAEDLSVNLSAEKLYCEGEISRPGQRRLIVAVTYTPLYDERQRLVNIIVNVDDITRFREEEEMKSTFTSIISHELKTPVALIKGYAQTLARPDAEWDGATARQSLQIIEEEADRLEVLINNLLDASRIQASGLQLDLADVDIERLARKVADAYRIQTAEHIIELDFPQRLPPVWGDEERLRQVMTNLVGNAIKYSPHGGTIRIGGWIETSPNRTAQRRLVFYVADQGIGIPQEELAHIFERFYRVDNSLRRSTAGAGLGLYLSRVIAEAHGGAVWVRSEPHKGTTFFVALPLEDEEK